MTSRYALLGLDDEVTACELCGKADLKCTMALSELDADGNELGIVRFGRDCGARALGWRVSADRAEKIARGTATMRGADSDRIFWATGGNTGALYSGTPARVEVSGITLEVWDAFYGALPAGQWTRLSKNSTHYWRAAS